MKTQNKEEMATAILKAFSNYKKDMEDYPEPEVSTNVHVKEHNGTNGTNGTHKDTIGSSPKAKLEVAYRIQIASSSKSTIDARYHQIEDLEVIKEGDIYKFVVGYFSSADAARPRLSALKADGFEGAFIVAYKDGQRIKA